MLAWRLGLGLRRNDRLTEARAEFVAAVEETLALKQAHYQAEDTRHNNKLDVDTPEARADPRWASSAEEVSELRKLWTMARVRVRQAFGRLQITDETICTREFVEFVDRITKLQGTHDVEVMRAEGARLTQKWRPKPRRRWLGGRSTH